MNSFHSPDNTQLQTGASKPDQAIQGIAKAIIRGEFLPGQFLPSESELGKRYGFSRSVVREAIRRLTATGMVETKRGVGTYVMASERWHLLDPLMLQSFIDSGNLPTISRELVQLRSSVEVESAGIAAKSITPNQTAVLKQWLDIMDLNLHDNPEAFARADVAFHDVIIAATENRFFIQIMNYLAYPIITARRITTIQGGLEARSEAQSWHRQIYDALLANDSEHATTAMRNHMSQLAQVIEQALLLVPSSIEI